MRYFCRTCSQVFTNVLISLDDMKDLSKHLRAGGIIPDGQCPLCAGLVYRDDRFATEEEIDRARSMYQCSEVQIDNDAKASRADEHIWIQAWVYVPK